MQSSRIGQTLPPAEIQVLHSGFVRCCQSDYKVGSAHVPAETRLQERPWIAVSNQII
jgi:hypothetical protein